MSYEPLTDRERLILNSLRQKSYGFNELYRKLQRRMSRQTLKKELDHLVKMQLVERRKGRKGQKDVYQCREILIKFEERIGRLEADWTELFHRLEELSQLLNMGVLEPEKAGSMVVFLIVRAITSTASLGLSVDRTFSMDAKRRLFNFSVDKFYSFLDRVFKLGEDHPEILDGFEKSSREIVETVRRAYKEIEDKLGEFRNQ